MSVVLGCLGMLFPPTSANSLGIEQLEAMTSSPHSDASRAIHLLMASGSQSFLTTWEPQGILVSLIYG